MIKMQKKQRKNSIGNYLRYIDNVFPLDVLLDDHWWRKHQKLIKTHLPPL